MIRNKAAREAMVRLLRNARYEVLPVGSTEEKVLDLCPKDRTVTVTASPGKGLEATLDARRVARQAQGYVAVPHLAARMVQRPRRARGDLRPADRGRASARVFVPGGDAEPVGDYPDALSLLEDLTALGQAVRARRHHRLPGVAPDDQRRPHRAVDVGQAPLRDPHRQQPDLRPRRRSRPGSAGCAPRGITMPLLLGMPGPVERAKLLSMATKIGVGESTRFLAKNKGTFARLAAPGGFTGERFLEKCAPALRRAGGAGRGAARLHLQPDRRDRGLAQRPAASGCGRRTGG